MDMGFDWRLWTLSPACILVSGQLKVVAPAEERAVKVDRDLIDQFYCYVAIFDCCD
jgi:hypothetical protein